MENKLKKKLPLGVEDFKSIATSCYYVDKTMLIKEMIDRVEGSVTLFTRPRRFGKSLALSMIDYYFSIEHKNEKDIFENLSIMSQGGKYTGEMSKYPLVHFNFKNISGSSFKETYLKIKQAVMEEAMKHSELLSSDKLTSLEKERFSHFLHGDANETEVSSSARILTELLTKHYGEKTILLIDEYDAPIERARYRGFYDQAVSFFRTFYGESLKSNVSLRFAALTGVLQISKESLFSDLNNLLVDNVLGGVYSEYFGFSEDETLKMLQYYGAAEKLSEVKSWYDGYHFGTSKVFNPWSVVNYLFCGNKADMYWVNTGENMIFADLIFPKDLSYNSSLGMLLGRGKVKINVSNSFSYKDLGSDETALYSFLLATGYLTWTERDELTGERTLTIPNKETSNLFLSEVIKRYATFRGSNWPFALRNAFKEQNNKLIEELLTKYVVSEFSSFDYGLEKNYQCLVLGMSSILFYDAYVSSEVNTGEGRCDIIVTPKEKDGLGLVIEIKNSRSKQSNSTLAKQAGTALKRIVSKNYASYIDNSEIKHIIAYGMAFYKANAVIKSKETK